MGSKNCCCSSADHAGSAPGQQVNYDSASLASSAAGNYQEAREARIYVL